MSAVEEYRKHTETCDMSKTERLADAAIAEMEAELHNDVTISEPVNGYERWVRDIRSAGRGPMSTPDLPKAEDLPAALAAIVEAGRMSDSPRAVYCAEIARAAIERYNEGTTA